MSSYTYQKFHPEGSDLWRLRAVSPISLQPPVFKWCSDVYDNFEKITLWLNQKARQKVIFVLPLLSFTICGITIRQLGKLINFLRCPEYYIHGVELCQKSCKLAEYFKEVAIWMQWSCSILQVKNQVVFIIARLHQKYPGIVNLFK